MKIKFLLVFALVAAFIVAQGQTSSSVITPQLTEQMNQKSGNVMIRINIRMAEQFDLSTIQNALNTMDKNDKRLFVVNELKAFRDESQADLLNFIDSKIQKKQARLIHSLWITNTVTCFATKEAINELASRTDIDRIDWDEERKMLIGDNRPEPAIPGDPDGTEEITWNVSILNVPSVWSLGFTGTGVTVAVIDTGVNYNHVDLQDHVWTDPSYPYHGYDFYNYDNNPMDDHGHGTHCSGTVAGDGTAGSQTGMAPDATIMCLKVLNSGGSGNESDVWAAIEFAVDHEADVISMSLGWQHSWGVDRTSWRSSFDNAQAAGVISSVAAGNEGNQQGTYPIPDNVRTPGDCPPPWLNPDQTLTGGTSGVVCVGATDSGNNAASFTSIGPVTWSSINPYNDYAYSPGMGLIRPDVSAPGVNIKSLAHYSNTGYEDGWDGTSMATPAVAGVMALMLDKNPNLTPVDINMALETTALDLGTSGKDNTYGAGRINGLSAVNAVSGPGPSYSSHTISDPNSNGEIEAGESIDLTIEMFNNSSSSNNNVTVNLSTASPYISITDNTEYYGNFTAGQYKSISGGFAFDVDPTTPGGENVQFNVEATNGLNTWNSQFNITTYGPSLEIGDISVSDPSGNNNGILDAGETADIILEVINNGQASISNVMVNLSTLSGYVALNNNSFNIPFIASGGTGNATFNVTVNPSTPVGTTAAFNYSASSGFYSINGSFSEVIGKTPVLIVDLDPNTSSGPAIQTAVQNNGVSVDYLTYFPVDLSQYSSLFICVGIFSNNSIIGTIQGQAVVDYMNAGGMVYLEGGDVWYYDPTIGGYNFDPLFGINPTADGSGDMSTLSGQTGTFTAGMSFGYSGENNWMDHIEAISPAFKIFQNSSPSYGAAVAYDQGTYKTIGASFEFGGLTNGSSPSTKDELMYEYLDFFGLIPPPAPPTVNLAVFLEGPFSGSQMATTLNQEDMLPLSQPFNTAPWNYTGSESVASIPNADIVDWVLIEFRETTGDVSTATGATSIEKHAAFVKKNGTIVGMDGSTPIVLNSDVANNLFVAIWHRNHLGIISANPLSLTEGHYDYNFSTGSGQAYGTTAAQKNLASGIWGMICGDGNGDGDINDLDHDSEWSNDAGNAGYGANDYNMDGQANNPDKDDFWFINRTKYSFIPD
ncbi:MAG: S8 family serine peptidase [Bacteroidales bacterium]|nr:S8 family serine peptidase [Bacteroidales bacterium]